MIEAVLACGHTTQLEQRPLHDYHHYTAIRCPQCHQAVGIRAVIYTREDPCHAPETRPSAAPNPETATT